MNHSTDVDAASTNKLGSKHNGDAQVNVSNANTNNQQHDHKEAPLMSRDHKRPIAHTTTDSSSNHNQQQQQQQQQHQQHCIITCSEMRDVWINEIGPKLCVIDIVKLSMVNQWARHIAHNIKQHNGYSTVTSVAEYCEGVVCWPDLQWELELEAWSQSHKSDSTAGSKWCNVVSLTLFQCDISDFSFVEPRKLEKFAFTAHPSNRFQMVGAIASLLMSCIKLGSLSLDGLMNEDDDVEWLVNVLAHHTHLLHLSLWGNDFGAVRMKQVCGVLCHMSHITSLNLGWNSLADEGAKCVCDCIHNMPNIITLYLAQNNIGPQGANCIRSALANKHHLTELIMFDNEIASEGVRHLLSCLTQLPKLAILDVELNCVDDETMQQVQRQLSHVKDLIV